MTYRMYVMCVFKVSEVVKLCLLSLWCFGGLSKTKNQRNVGFDIL